MNEIVLNIKNLSFSFGGLKALNQVNMICKNNEVHALIGPNGAGKSTLINAISGELSPSNGSIKIQGKDTQGLSKNQVARLGIGHVFQTTNIFPSFTVFENCVLAAQTQLPYKTNIFGRADKYPQPSRIAHENIEKVQLGSKMFAKANSLSHGDQKKTEIAMVLCAKPKLLLLDEPLAGMSGAESEMILSLIDHLKTKNSILVVEHDVDAVLSIAQTVSVIANGRIIKCGSPNEVRSDPLVQQVYFGDNQEKFKNDKG